MIDMKVHVTNHFSLKQNPNPTRVMMRLTRSQTLSVPRKGRWRRQLCWPAGSLVRERDWHVCTLPVCYLAISSVDTSGLFAMLPVRSV